MHVPDDELIGAGTGDFGLFLGFMRGKIDFVDCIYLEPYLGCKRIASDGGGML